MSATAYLNRADILSKTKLPMREIDVPEWGGTVFVSVMTAGERDAWEIYVSTSKSKDIRARTAVACVCDSAGARLFTEDDMPAVSQLHSRALDRIFEAAIPLNEIGGRDMNDLKTKPSPGAAGRPGSE